MEKEQGKRNITIRQKPQELSVEDPQMDAKISGQQFEEKWGISAVSTQLPKDVYKFQRKEQ